VKTPALVLYEDTVARALEPFALTRPTTELGAGAVLLRERWVAMAPKAKVTRVGAPHLAGFDEPGTPRTAQGMLSAGTLVASARFAPALAQKLSDAGDPDAWMADGRLAAVRLGRPIDAAALADGTLALDALLPKHAVTAPITGWWIDHAWDLVRHLGAMLAADVPALGAALETHEPRTLDDVRVSGSHEMYIEDGAAVEPFVLLDAQFGPILVRRGARIQAFTRLVGPCAVGAGSTVHGGKVANSAIGEDCRVHGEVSTSLFLGQCNKAHDGFVGHSVLGRWANLGAGTTTSNLKNSYGTVQMWSPAGVVDTGMQFLGSLIGDHAKLAIGTQLMTGTLIGAGASVFGATSPAKAVPPFSWGSGDAVYAIDKFLDVAQRVLQRRGAVLSDAMRAVLTDAHARRWNA
jgi:UDP-N-acetylglucosamine diphosphorylase/glucosamine-1-phosphate N-acetyltransferase